MRMRKKNYSPIALGETAGLSNEEWLKWREHGPHYDDPFHEDYINVCLGGSSVGAVFGDSPWVSRLELFHQKSGVATPKYSRPMNQAILDAGHQLEDFVANMFLAKMAEEGVKNIELWNDTVMYQHPLHKYAVVNLDRRIKVNGLPGILECKTTGNYEDIANWKNGIVKKSYEWQCRYYMATMNLDFCYICCCWGFTLKECAVILIKRDLEIEKEMFAELDKFVECCELGVEPEMQTSHMKVLSTYYNRLYGELPEKAPAVELPDTEEVYDLVEACQTIAARKAKAEAVVKAIEEEEYTLTAKLMHLTGGKSTYATYRMDEQTVVAVKIKQPMKRASFNAEKFKSEHPDLYDKYKKESLDVTTLKKQEKALAASYVIPARVNDEEPCTIGNVEVKNIPVTV